MSRVLIFSPWGLWGMFTHFEAVVGLSLRLRGHEVLACSCDGSYASCQLVQHENTCRDCLSTGHSVFSKFGIPVITFKDVIPPPQQMKLLEEVQQLDICNPEAVTELLGPRAETIVMSGVAHRRSSSDMQFADFENEKRVVIYNLALTRRIVQELQRRHSFDASVIFSGQHHLHCMAAEEMGRLGARVLLFTQTSPKKDGFQLYGIDPGETFHSTYAKGYESWKNMPLSSAQIAKVAENFTDLFVGKNPTRDLMGEAFNQAQSKTVGRERLRSRLRIPLDAEIVTYFCSTDYEVLVNRTAYSMPNQTEFLSKLIELFNSRSEYLVIRTHPAVTVDRGALNNQLNLARMAGPRVRFIHSREIFSSYDLIPESSAVITCGSTIGLESFHQGKASVSMGNVLSMEFSGGAIRVLQSFDEVETALDECKQRNSRPRTIKEMQDFYRGIYHLWYRSYPILASYRVAEDTQPLIRINSFAELAPGCDPTLDSICQYISNGEPFVGAPGLFGVDELKEEIETLQALYPGAEV